MPTKADTLVSILPLELQKIALMEQKSKSEAQNVYENKKRKLEISDVENWLTKKHIQIKLNQISHKADYTNIKNENMSQIENNLATIIFDEIQNDFLGVTIDKIFSFLRVIISRKEYNPILEWLAKVEYKKIDELQKVFQILGITNDELSKTLVKKWLWQCLALLKNNFNNNFGADGVLVLQGIQGCGKTSFFRKLAVKPDWFLEGANINFADKDTIVRATAVWISELGEIESTFRSDIEKLKALITLPKDTFRLPYARANVDNVRHASFCGTCNSTKFLIDATGNRRFWTVKVDDVHLDLLSKLDVAQLWKQIECEYLSKDLQGFRLTKSEQLELQARNSTHEKSIKSEDEIRDILEQCKYSSHFKSGFITVSDFKSEHYVLSKYSSQQIGLALDKIGISAERKKIDGAVGRYRFLPKRTYDR